MIETRLYVSFYEPVRSPPCAYLTQGGMTSPLWTETMRSFAELRFVIRFQQTAKHFLNEFIRPGGHTQRTLPHHPHEFRDG
jgi:hypothetical protein